MPTIRTIRFVLPFVAALALAAAPAGAVTIFTATLTNAAEVPPAVPTDANGDPRPASFGTATFELSDDQSTLTFTVTVENIDFTGSQTADPNDDLSVAHIHGGETVTPTTTAGVVFGFIGTPFNDTSPTDTVVTPFATGVGGTVTSKWDAAEGNATTLTEQLDNLFAGRLYINFHTTQFPAGEIRGALVLIPEPATGLGLALGLAVLAARRR